MRLEARLLVIALTLSTIGLTLVFGDGFEPPRPQRRIAPEHGEHADSDADVPERGFRVAPSARPTTDARSVAPVLPENAPEQTKRPDRPGDHPSPEPRSPRARTYDAVLIAAYLSPGSVEPAALRRFWREAADRNAPDEAIDALLALARDNLDRPGIAHAALDQREDLIALRERIAAEEEDIVGSVTGTESTPLELESTSASSSAPTDPPGLDDESLAQLDHVIRHDPEVAPVRHAVDILALERDVRVSEVLLEATHHPDAGPRHAALLALWRTAADGQAASDDVRDSLIRARYDLDPGVARVAERALEDLDRLESSRSVRLARLDTATAIPEACPIELCEDTGEGAR